MTDPQRRDAPAKPSVARIEGRTRMAMGAVPPPPPPTKVRDVEPPRLVTEATSEPIPSALASEANLTASADVASPSVSKHAHERGTARTMIAGPVGLTPDKRVDLATAAHADTTIPSSAPRADAMTREVGAPEPVDATVMRVGTSFAGTEGLSPPGTEAPKLRLASGKLLPGTRYKILRWIGEGGMGVVYEAEHADIERRVALKILRFDLSHQPRMARVFRDEARASSRLGSPNIVEVYDFGELPDGRLFFCMELLDGKDLVPSPDNPCMDPAELISVLRQVCKGLHAAHEAGVVHRDVKPENLLRVTRGGRAGTIKIVDFGISAMIAAGPAQQSGAIAGTPHYMAPEQITGQAFDRRLDVYALGCTAYELLVGRPPFDATDLPTLLEKHLTEVPVPPSRAGAAYPIPAALEAVILQCLAKDPNARPSDMAELEALLCEAQIEAGLHTPWDDLPIPELADGERRDRLIRDMPSPLKEFDAQRRRRGWAWPLVAGLSTFAAAGLGLFLMLGTGPTDEERSAVERLADAAKDAAAQQRWIYPPKQHPKAPTAYLKILELEHVEGAAEGLADERAAQLRQSFAAALVQQADEFWQTPELRRFAREYYSWALLLDPDDRQAFERSGLTAAGLADLRERIGQGDYSAAELAMAQMLAAAKERDPDQRELLLADAGAELEALAPTMFEAETLYGSGLLRRKAKPKAPEPVVEPEPVLEPELEIVDEGSVATDVPPLPPPEPEPVRAKKLVRPPAILGKADRDPTRASELGEQGMAALRSGRRKEAEALFNQAIAYDRRNALALSGLSDVYFDTGADQKAVLYAERAVEAAPAHQSYRLKLGDAYFKVLRYRDALTQYQEAKQRGETRADQRIAKVKSRLGE